MKFSSKIAVGAVALALTSTTAFAGKLERGVRNISPLFQLGTYAEFSAAYIRPFSEVNDTFGGSTEDFYRNDTDLGVAYKMDWTKNFSSAIIVDEPFGVNLDYGPASALTGVGANLTSIAITSLYRYKFDRGFSVYGGSRSQYTSFDVQLGGLFPAPAYNADAKGDWGHGFVVGAAYEIPALRVLASVTYHSEIEHEWDITETTAGAPLPGGGGQFTNQTPQGVDFDFRFPVKRGTLVYGSVHWADWSETSLSLPSVPTPILEYKGDVWGFKLGLAQALRPDWIVTADVSYELESDELTTPFRTRDGEFAIGLASIHRFKGATLTLGGKYKFFKDNDPADDADPFPAGPLSLIRSYENQSALVLGMKIGFQILPTPPAAPPMK